MTGALLAWTPTGWRPVPEVPGDPLVADSWLVEEGRSRWLDRHRARFTDSCAASKPAPKTPHSKPAAATSHSKPAPATSHAAAEFTRGACQAALPGSDAFWEAVVERLAAEPGELFPRVELVRAELPLRLRIRVAPPRTERVTVWVADGPDPRTSPLVKGPDLTALGELRRRAIENGATEALILGPGGEVLEGATSALLWWEGERLCLPARTELLLPSVTQDAIVRRARERGIAVERADRQVSELAGREVWFVNALHGIRQAGAEPSTARTREWREWWRTAAVPLSTRP